MLRYYGGSLRFLKSEKLQICKFQPEKLLIDISEKKKLKLCIE